MTDAPHRVLIVDDDFAVRALISLGFERQGIDTNVAEDGRQAIELLGRSRAYCCAILDLHIPPPDGFAIAEYIRENCPTLPVIVVSGHAELLEQFQNEDVAKIARQVFMKPVDVPTLVRFVHPDSRCIGQS